jgi:pimeloyl-ACP methyl ester carboxylesterase
MIADQGFFWVGIERKKTPQGTVAAGPMYLRYQIPHELRHPWPIVMVHGGGGQGLDYLGTPDGRPGWATFFLRQGYAVYVVDRPGLGRSPYHPEVLGPMSPLPTYELTRRLFTEPAATPDAFPQARLHNQWPGKSAADADDVLDQLVAGFGPSVVDLAQAHERERRCGADLLDRIGPAILVTCSAGGPFGWLAADARPACVKAIIAIEPVGPPFSASPMGKLSWGLTAAPLTFEPPAASADDLKTALKPAPRIGLKDCFVQAEPARRLVNFKDFPILVVTSEASWMAQDGHGVVDFLVQAGAQAEQVRLEDEGIRGNGHMMMLETNSDEIAALLHRWLSKRGLAASPR